MFFLPQAGFYGEYHELSVCGCHDHLKVGQFGVVEKAGPPFLWKKGNPGDRISDQLPVLQSQHEYVAEKGEMTVDGCVAPLSPRSLGLHAYLLLRLQLARIMA